MTDDVSVAEAIRLEHRLTKIEEAIVANTVATEQVALHVAAQNGRITKNEGRLTNQELFQARVLTLIGALGFVSPLVFGLVFFGLEKWVGN